jgi:predicted DsbA family dithiol-disulfide isomerase
MTEPPYVRRTMPTARATLYFDFADPISYLVERELLDVVGDAEPPSFEPFEIRPPPSPLVAVDDPSLRPRWALAREITESETISLSPPELVPWSRKAHELHLLARDLDLDRAVRAAIHEAYLLEGRDIGRVDVLVELAVELGMDRTKTKAVLDVDRHQPEVLEARARAGQSGVTDAPTLVTPSGRLQGFHNASTLRTFLRDVPREAP